jgi:predicted MFS family arabinose efflux permease
VSALPASLLFGALWDWRGATTAFGFGAAMAAVAAILAAWTLPRGRIPRAA